MARPVVLCASPRFNVWHSAVFLLFVLFAVQPSFAQTLTVLHTFAGLDGLSPYSGVVMDAGGNLYGTTYGGGPNHLGTVYQLKRHGSSYVHLELYSFKGSDDGAQPYGGVAFGPGGALYGTTWTGGGGAGTVYSLRPSATPCRTVICPWSESLRYDVEQVNGVDPAYGNVAFDAAGNLYGTTAFDELGSYGEVYELSRSGSGWTGSVVHEFGTNDVNYPAHNVILDSAGNLYGTAIGPGNGAIFQFVPSGSGWTEHILAYFGQPGTCTGFDLSGLIMDAAGNLFGATTGDGHSACVFELANVGGTWQFTVLHTFDNITNNSQAAVGNMVFDHSGNLYGTTMQLGAFGMGNIFKLTHSGGSWTYSDVYDFSNAGDGAYPTGDLTIDNAGNIYGTNQGDASGHGVVWELTP